MKTRVFSTLAVAALAVSAVALTPAASLAAKDKTDTGKIEISAVPVPLNPDDGMQERVGRLRYRGGIELSSTNILFGGLSGLDVSADGKKLVAMSDNGRWVAAALLYDEHGNLTGAADGVMKPIKRAVGYATPGNWRDAEAIARDGNGGYFVAFERQHRIWHYRTPPKDPFDAVPFPLPGPKDIADQPNNGGIEGLVRLCDRRLFAISEQAAADEDAVKAWVFDGKRWKDLRYVTTENFHPTGAAVLPNCNVAVLERSFAVSQGVRGRVVVIPAKDVRPDATIRGEEVARIVPPVTVDNMEGIAARKGDNGEPLVYIVSDNNFSPLQRTIVLMFELMPPPEKK